MRRALVVGIDGYASAQDLHGCVNDARAIGELLRVNHDGSPNFAVRSLLAPAGQSVSRVDLSRGIDELFRDEADVALLYFSGHGTENDLGGYLVTSDVTAYAEGVPMTEVLTKAQKSKAREVLIVLDSCHSGGLGQVPAVADHNLAVIREGVSILTASRSTQAAMETGGAGVFSALVVSALEGGAADVLGPVNVASLYAYVDQALGPWDQRPLFKAHVSTLIPLRTCQPPIAIEIVRRLPEWFSTPDSEFALDPSFEPKADPPHKQHEEVFGCLQRCVAARLVQPVGADHMYFAAVEGKSCRMTALGKHYWLLAKKGHV